MPTVSPAQERLMQGVAHNPAFAKKVGIPQSVGKEFVGADEVPEITDDPLHALAHPKEDADPCWSGYKQVGMKEKDGKPVPNCVPEDDSEAWQRKEGKNKNGGLNEKGRESYNKEHHAHLKAPQPEGGSRKESFCARMQGMKEKLTSEETKNDPDSRINKSLRKWKCDDEGAEMPYKAPIDPQGGPFTRAAGIMFVTVDGEILLIRRGNGGDYPGTWAVPGGHLCEGESDEQAARRECKEETGIDFQGPLERLHDDGQFVTFLARGVEKFPVHLNYESTGYDWCRPDDAPAPLHPGQAVAFRVAGAGTELDIAQLMMEDILPSPQPYGNMHLLNIRITGTGLAYRSKIGEHVWRDASLYLNQEFVDRCNGLMVIMDHPDGAVLDTKEFKDRAIGSIMLPYIKGDEVWGIAKIYDDKAMAEICEGDISTSPAVVFDEFSGNTTLRTEAGEPLLIEGTPFLLDHIAIVTKSHGSKGVWDKGGEPAGVLLTNPEVSDMTEKLEPKADAAGDAFSAILSELKKLSVRMDAMENMPAPPLVSAADKKRKDDDESMMDDDSKMDDDEEAEEHKYVARKGDDDMKKKDDDMMKKKKRKDAEGSNPVVHGPAGEMKPDDEDAKKDDDDEEEEAMKADEEEAAMADAQAHCDSVMAAFGKAASRPLKGENLMAYRKRLLRGVQGYSDSWKNVDLKAIKDNAMLAIAEKQIYAEALAASKAPGVYADGQLVEMTERDRAGRTITKFKGSISAWLDDFKLPAMRVTAFNLPNNNQR